MKYILTFLVLFFLLSCRHGNKKSNAQVDPKAIALNDSAVKFSVDTDAEKLQQAVKLLNQALKIQPDYYLAQINKFGFQVRLGLKDSAFQTLKKIEQLKPEDPEIRVAAGLLIEKYGDSLTARMKFQKAEDLYKSKLDTMNKKSPRYEMVLANRAVNLKFLGKEKEAKEMLKSIETHPENIQMKEFIDLYISRPGHELKQQINDSK